MAKKSITVEVLKEYVRKEASQFLKQPNVTSVGIGYKIQSGKPTKELALQFTVGRKVAPELLGPGDAIPNIIKVNGIDVPTDVIQRSFDTHFREIKIEAKLEAATPRKVVVDPIIPGVSVGHPSITAGTVGCVVYDARTGAPYILSNWHVLNGETGVIGDSIVQPGRHDDNRVDQNIVGRLVRSHLGVAGDCAVASIDNRRLATEIADLGIAVQRIGEPELDDRLVKSGRTTEVTFGIVKRVNVVAKLNYGTAGDQDIGCFEIGPDDDHPAANDQISMGGDSGAAWMAVERNRATTLMLGLHFAGEVGDEPDHALACYPGSVFEKLEIRPTPLDVIPEAAASPGYAASFLGDVVALPQPSNANSRADLLDVNGRNVFDYMHFSLSMSASRKFAKWVAWNIDGNGLRRLSRDGIPFKKDPSIPAEAQIGNELYSNNSIDRGHIARRADLLWGTVGEAERANTDSFFYSNITPQHAEFNQSGAGGIWGALEDAVFSDVDVANLRISVIGGPIFSSSDPLYRGVRLPKQFFKIIYYRESESEQIKAKGYVLTQADLLNALEVLELPEFAVYEVTITNIGEMTDLILPGTDAPEVAPVRARRGSKREAVAATTEPNTVRRITRISEIINF